MKRNGTASRPGNPGIVEFASPITATSGWSADQQNARLDALSGKLSRVQVPSAAEMQAVDDQDRDIEDAYIRSNGKQLDIRYRSPRSSNEPVRVKIPDGMAFTPEEIELANWVAQYAQAQKLPFNDAMTQVFDYLKRNPNRLAAFTGKELNFAEASPRTVGFTVPAGWSCDPRGLEDLQRYRVYQAVTGCSFSEAIADLGA